MNYKGEIEYRTKEGETVPTPTDVCALGKQGILLTLEINISKLMLSQAALAVFDGENSCPPQ